MKAKFVNFCTDRKKEEEEEDKLQFFFFQKKKKETAQLKAQIGKLKTKRKSYSESD